MVESLCAWPATRSAQLLQAVEVGSMMVAVVVVVVGLCFAVVEEEEVSFLRSASRIMYAICVACASRR